MSQPALTDGETDGLDHAMLSTATNSAERVAVASGSFVRLWTRSPTWMIKEEEMMDPIQAITTTATKTYHLPAPQVLPQIHKDLLLQFVRISVLLIICWRSPHNAS